MTDTEIVEWLQNNMKTFFVLPPEHEEDWSVYEHGHCFISRGPTLRDCIENASKRLGQT